MPLIQGKSKKAFKQNLETEMEAGKPKKQSLAIAYSVQRKNKRKMAKGGLLSAETEKKATADNQAMFADGGLVRAGSERPTADAHECTDACQNMTVREHEMVRAGSGRATADSMEGNPAGTMPTTGGSAVRAGSTRVSADSGERTNAPDRRAASPGRSNRAASSRPTADNDQMGSTQMLAYGGDVEGEDTSMHDGTLAEAIARRLAKHLMAEGGEVEGDPRDDIDDDSVEHGNYADDLNFDALGKENYDEDQLSEQPEDSNEKGDDEESESEDKDDKSIISKIRARAKSKKA